MAPKPKTLSFVEAASAPIVAVTAWQMLFEYAHGAAGNVGAYAVQLAKRAGLHVVATAGPADLDYVRGLGAETVVDYQTKRFEDSVARVDVVLDTVGGDTQRRSLRALKPCSRRRSTSFRLTIGPPSSCATSEGLSTAEVADAKSRAHRARLLLRKRLSTFVEVERPSETEVPARPPES
jgi:threonine dehydrogenase-like Zn-dependent dehydrogenase